MTNEPAQEIEPDAAGGNPSWTPLDVENVGWLFPQFAILKTLGSGSLGSVYHGFEAAKDRTAAIKILALEISTTPGVARMFAKTLPTVTQFAHAHIVRVHEFGITAQEHLFYVMDLVEGATLRQRIRSRELTAPQALAMIEQVCDAAHHAHGHGIVHGMLHPGNVFIDRHGPVKVADFGLTRLGVPIPRAGVRDYCPPEVLDGRPADHRADVYSAGVMLYEALTGDLPHADSRPASQVAGMNERIDLIIARAMDPLPEGRYQSSAEMMRAIGAIRGMEVTAKRAATDAVPMAVVVEESAGPDNEPAVEVVPLDGRKRPRRPLWMAGAAAGVGTVIAGFFAVNSMRHPAATPRPVLKVAEWPTQATPEPMIQRKPEVAKASVARSSPTAAPVAPSKPAAPAKPIAGTWFPVSLEAAKSGGLQPVEGGGIHVTKSVRFDQIQGRDVAIRASIRLAAEEPKSAQIWLRSAGPARVQISLDGKPNLTLQTTPGENKFRSFGSVTAPWALVGERWVTVEVATIGEKLIGAVNGRAIPAEGKSDVLESGGIGIYSSDADFKDLSVMLLDGVEPGKYPDFVAAALAPAVAKTPEPATPVPEPTPPPPTPAPELPKASAEVQAWLAAVEKPFLESYQKEVVAPFDAAAGAIRQRYLATLDQQVAATSQAGKLEEAVAWRKERSRFYESGQNVPPDDADNPLPAIKPLRAGFRAQFSKVDRERYERARLQHAKYDAVLAQNQGALTQRQRLDDALLLKGRRDELAKAWLVPPAAAVPAGPALGAATKSVGAAEAPRTAIRETAEWLLANGAELTVQEGNNKWAPVIDPRLIANGKPVFRMKIEAAKFKMPPTAEDLRRLGTLRNVAAVEIIGAFSTEAYAFLRELSGVRRVQLSGEKLNDKIADQMASLSELQTIHIRYGLTMTGKTFDQFARFPNLKTLDLEGSGFDNDGAAAVAKIDALEELNVRRTKLTDIGLAHFARLRNLRKLEIGFNPGITPAGIAPLKALNKLEMVDFLHDGLPDFAAAVRQMMATFPRLTHTRVQGKTLGAEQLNALAGWRALKQLAIHDSEFADGALAALSQFTNLDILELNSTTFGDADVDHVLGLRGLRRLNLNGTKMTDAALLKFKTMKNLKELNLGGTGTTVEGVRALEREHPGLKVTR